MQSFNEYQQWTRTIAKYEDPMYPVLGLAEEAGELAGKYGKCLRDKTEFPKEAVKKELGDVLWMAAAIAHDNGWTLSEVAQANVDKLESRKERGVLGGSGDNR